jgi:hypothetical protein
MLGYISCVVYRDSTDGRSSRDEFWIFAADDLQGKTKPIYRLICSQPLNIGFTIHSIWLPTIVLGKYPEDRRRQMRETSFNADFSDIIARRGPIVRSLANDIMKPHFIQHTPAAAFDKSIQES